MSTITKDTFFLTGDDSINFAKNYYYPDLEEINHFKEHINKINDSINIERTTDGFDIEIKDLDLSFLDKEVIKRTHTLKTIFSLECKKMTYLDENEFPKEISIDFKNKEEYIDIKNEEIWNLAA